MSAEDRARWDEKWAERGAMRVNGLLQSHAELLPGGVALDVACGQGQNAIWLAQHGERVLGVDISRVALRAARKNAVRQGVGRRTLFAQVDLDRWRPPRQALDLICVFRFLDRDLLPALRQALHPAGVLIYETIHMGILARDPARTTAYLLRPGELAATFADWEILFHEIGDEREGVIARRPAGDVSRETPATGALPFG